MVDLLISEMSQCKQNSGHNSVSHCGKYHQNMHDGILEQCVQCRQQNDTMLNTDHGKHDNSRRVEPAKDIGQHYRGNRRYYRPVARKETIERVSVLMLNSLSKRGFAVTPTIALRSAATYAIHQLIHI